MSRDLNYRSSIDDFWKLYFEKVSPVLNSNKRLTSSTEITKNLAKTKRAKGLLCESLETFDKVSSSFFENIPYSISFYFALRGLVDYLNSGFVPGPNALLTFERYAYLTGFKGKVAVQ